MDMAKTAPLTRADGEVRELTTTDLEHFGDATSLPARLQRKLGVRRLRGALAAARAVRRTPGDVVGP